MMNEKGQSSDMSLEDVYYALFRHKWKIAFCTILGTVAAAALFLLKPAPAQSEAKLFIRYIVDGGAPSPGNEARTRSPDERGENIVNAEVEILTSLDLAKNVVSKVGAEAILAKQGGGNDAARAAALVKNNLTVDASPRSSVIRIAFQHPDPAVVQPVLREVIDNYFKEHIQIHRAPGIVGGFLSQETDYLRSQIAETEAALRKARNKSGIVSIDEAKRANATQFARIRQELFDAEAQLAEQRGALKEMPKSKPASVEKAIAGSTVPMNQIVSYTNLCGRLDSFRKREQELLLLFTEATPMVQEVRGLIAKTEGTKRQMEEKHPALVLINTSAPNSAEPQGELSALLLAAPSRIAALEARIKTLGSQLNQIRAEAVEIDEAEPVIQELQRKKELAEASYKYFSSSLEQSRLDAAQGPGKISNISTIQSPSPPFHTGSRPLLKKVAMVFCGGIFGGLAWAFVLELYIDRTVRRPFQIEKRLGLPLLLCIPKRRIRARASLPAIAKGQPGLSGSGNTSEAMSNTLLPRPATWDFNGALRPFHEALRDKIMADFEAEHLIRKPKLVAVTEAGKGGGVTTIATALAASFSETGAGNVLLVDMNLERGAACQFNRGRPDCGLDDVLSGNRENAQVKDNLFVVSERASKERLTGAAPTRFTNLMPKLKASDYDYIVFDMPPITQTSVTPRMAGFMDMVLLVVESEKTDLDVVRRAVSLLGDSKGKVSAVFNKTRNYIPVRLHREYLDEV